MLRPQCDALFKQSKVINKLLFVMVDALVHEIKERLQIITLTKNYDQFFTVAMTYTAFKAHPAARVARRIVDVAVIIFIAAHGSYACYAHTTADTWEERVFIIERDWQFKLLNPLNDGIGFALPFVSVAYVSREAIDRLGMVMAFANYYVAENFSEDFWLTWTTFLDMPLSIGLFYAIIFWARKKSMQSQGA